MEEIIIQPKMSFERDIIPTTHFMIQQMLEMDFKDKKFGYGLRNFRFGFMPK